MTPAQRSKYALAVHESAHAVVATVLGHRIREVKLGHDPKHPTRVGWCAYSTDFGNQDRAAVCYSGPYAEAFYLAGGPPTRRALNRALDGTEDLTAMTAAGDTHPANVPRLIASCWPSVNALAAHLHRTGKATQADVDAALHLPADDQDGRGAALAAIRSGSVPGSFTITAPLA